MPQARKKPVLLMVDDDEEDIYLTRRAFLNYSSDLIFNSVHSGTDMFDYLLRRGEFENNDEFFLPTVILLDINMPRENGYAVLRQLRDSEFAYLPVSILTTSSANHDVKKAYQCGASTYICKSVSKQGMEDVAKQFCDYWLDFAKLPNVA